MVFEFSESIAESILQLMEGFEGFVRHGLFSEVLPEMFDRIEFRAM